MVPVAPSTPVTPTPKKPSSPPVAATPPTDTQGTIGSGATMPPPSFGRHGPTKIVGNYLELIADLWNQVYNPMNAGKLDEKLVLGFAGVDTAKLLQSADILNQRHPKSVALLELLKLKLGKRGLIKLTNDLQEFDGEDMRRAFRMLGKMLRDDHAKANAKNKKKMLQQAIAVLDQHDKELIPKIVLQANLDTLEERYKALENQVMGYKPSPPSSGSSNSGSNTDEEDEDAEETAASSDGAAAKGEVDD